MLKNVPKAKDQQQFSTSDLPLVALLTLYFPIHQVDISNPKRATFIFKGDSQKIYDLVSQYLSGQLLVEPRKYFDQIKEVKTRLYSSGR